jgi:hypothetical protein
MGVAFFVLAFTIDDHLAILFSDFEVNGFLGCAEIGGEALSPAIIATKGHADFRIFYIDRLTAVKAFKHHVVPPVFILI